MMTKSNPLVSIITVNFNSTQVTLDLLESLKLSEYQPIETIVIDNGSIDDPENLIRTKAPEAIFKRSPQNVGFAGGNNLGIEVAKGQYYFFINNDTEVSRSLITNMVRVFQSNLNVGAVSPKIIYYSTNTIQYAGYTSMSSITARNEALGNKQQDSTNFTGLHKTPYAHGAAMMVSRTVVNKVGRMPEDFFLYYEELDWCEQIKRAGYDVMVDLSSVIYHKESMSVGKASPLKLFYQTRNRILFVRRNMDWRSNISFHIYFYFFVSPIKLLKYLTRGDWQYVKTYWRAILMAKNYVP
jgi:GT2 family glycosyltransferase